MDEQQRRTIRTAAYLASQERHDRRAALSTRTGKTRGKVDCNPPNKRCGNRCIPPSWDCRLEGKGTNSELAAHKTDPLAGIASIQRGAKDLARGVVRLNPSQVQRGRNSVIRGVVKLAPGDNLEQKKKLKRQLTQASTPVMAVIGIGLVGLGAHAGLKRGFGSYRNGLGADIDRAAARAVDSVLDRVPGVSNIRAARRAAGVAATTEIAQAVQRGGRIESVRAATSGNTGKIGPLSFRPLSADTEASHLRDQLNGLTARARSGSLSYDSWKQEAVQTIYGAQSPGTRARGQRGSIFSEHAANEFLVSKFQLNPTGAVGPRGGYSMAARNALIDTQLTEKLQGWGQSLRNDMTLRRFVGPNGAIRDTDVDRYIRELGSSTLGPQLAGLSAAQRNQAVSEAHRLMRSAINGTNLNREARAMRRGLVSEFDTYFDNVARSMQRNAAASDSPFGDGMTGLARYLSRQQGQTTQIMSRDHADLILRNHFHSRVMELKNDFAIGDNTARRVAQQLTRSADLPDADSAYRILNENGFSRLSRGGPTTGRKANQPNTRRRTEPATPTPAPAAPAAQARPRRSPRSSGGPQSESDLIKNAPPGMSPEEARQWARRMWQTHWARRDEAQGLVRTATYLAARADLKEGSRLGKPCGESHIPKSHECRKYQSVKAEGGTSAKTAATLAIAAGAAVGAAALASNPKLRQRVRVESRLILQGSDKAVRKALMLGGRGTVAGLSVKQVKEGLDKLPEAFQGPARKLVGAAKQGAAAMALKAEGYSIQDIDVVNNFSTWKNKKGTLISIGSYGDSLVTYASDNSHSWNGKRVYKIGFNVDQNFDATRNIPTEQARNITSAVRKMTDNHLTKINDGILATFPWDGDDFGSKRRAIYSRAGFNNIVGEESQWALVQKGRIKKMTSAESFIYLAESGERDAPIYKPSKKERKDGLTKFHGRR